MRNSTCTATVPEQLTHVGDYDAGIVTGGLDGVDEVKGAARGEGLLTEGTVGEDPKVLELFAEVKDCAGGGG